MATFLSPPVRRAVVFRPQRYRYASFAALVLLALAVCLFLGRPAPRSLAHVPDRHGPVGGPSGATTNGWTNLFPLLSAVSAVSSTEAWATGEYGTLLHFTGDQWADVDLPPLHGMYATDIKMLSPIRGWLAAGAHAFHYDGAGWVERSAGLAADGPTVDRLAVVTDSNVWGLGGYSLGNSRYQNLMHWNGSQWQVDSSVRLEIYDLDMAGPRDGWATALGNPSPILLHYDGASWTPTA
ncbi:MAG TPA: hypothetical protein VFM49_17625, partial [Chloroflexia bacterium]|nr:hypothetical protein [Chloroflexia bacterium]